MRPSKFLYCYNIENELYIRFFYCSKLDPAPRTRSSENVSRFANNENIKSMVISAQITAATSMLEIVGNSAIWTTQTFIAKFLGYGTLIQSIILYFVLLPYVFFMNTDKNKKMVIEDGWINLFKHVICNSFFNLKVTGTTNKVSPSSEENSNISSVQERKPDIFTICNEEDKDVYPTLELKYTQSTNDNLQMSEPSSSVSKMQVDSKDKNDNLSNKWSAVRLEIIYDLLRDVDDENSYICHFKELITLEDSVKQGKVCVQNFIEEREERKSELCKNNLKGNFKADQLRNSIVLQLECYEDEEVAWYERKSFSMFSDDITDRIRLRKEAINRLLKHSKDDEDIYKECLEMYIDMEENFII